MADYFGRQLIENASRGDLEGCRSALNNNADINYVDKDMRGAAYYAILSSHREVLKFLLTKSIDIEIQDVLGNSLLHNACDKKDKYIILYLLLEGCSWEVKNSNEKQPGQDQPDMKLFLSEITEEYRCFKAVPPDEMLKIKGLFEDIDYNGEKRIDIEKSIRFNKFNDKKVSNFIAEKDAVDFVNSCAIIDGEDVSFEEWYFAWAKLYVSDRRIYDKFFKEYEDVKSDSDMTFKELMNQEETY